MLPLRGTLGQAIIRSDEPGTHQRPPARCGASGCAPRGSTSSATRSPRGEDPEPLLRAALGGGVDIVQLREKELPRREIERRRAHLPPPLRHLQRPLHRQRRPRAGARLRRRRRPRRPGRHARRRGARDPRAGGDRRPLDPLRGADRRLRRGCRSTTSASARSGRRRPKQGRPGVGLELVAHAAEQRAASLLRDRRHRPGERRARWSRPARGGSASCGRSATPRTPAAAAEALRAALGARRRGGARWLRSARKRKERGRRAAQPRASGWSAATPRPRAQPGGARGARAAGRGRAAAGGDGRRRRLGADRALDRRRLPGRGRGRRRQSRGSRRCWRPRC